MEQHLKQINESLESIAKSLEYFVKVIEAHEAEEAAALAEMEKGKFNDDKGSNTAGN